MKISLFLVALLMALVFASATVAVAHEGEDHAEHHSEQIAVRGSDDLIGQSSERGGPSILLIAGITLASAAVLGSLVIALRRI